MGSRFRETAADRGRGRARCILVCLVAAALPPTKTTVADIDALASYLKSQIGLTSLTTLRQRISHKHTGARKIEAMKYLGLLERDGENVKLTEDGRAYADGEAAERAAVMAKRLRDVPLYHATIEWLHYTYRQDEASKTDVANHWHDHLSEESGGATGDSLADGVVFFLRMADVAEIGTFVAAGVGRDTHLAIDRERLAAIVVSPRVEPEKPKKKDVEPPVSPAPPSSTPTPLTVEAGLQVNVEIHIAADAKPATIEEIFKNMRKYLMSRPSESDGS